MAYADPPTSPRMPRTRENVKLLQEFHVHMFLETDYSEGISDRVQYNTFRIGHRFLVVVLFRSGEHKAEQNSDTYRHSAR